MKDPGFSGANPLAAAFDELRQVFPGSHFEIERVDIDSSGHLQFTAASKDGSRWFAHDDRGLIEQTPLGDTLIPLSRRLSEGNAENLHTVSYRPGRRMVVQERVNGSITILKGYRRKKSTPAVFNHRLAEEASEAGSFLVPRLVRHDLELETLVFEHLDGEPFLVEDSSAETCFRIGSLLGRFQAFERASELKRFRAEDEFGVLDTWRRKALGGIGRLPEGWEAARKLLDDALLALPEPDWGLCHRDLHDGQFLLVEDRPALLDFDLLCQGDVALDPANLLVHFTLRTLQGFRGADDRAARACGDALLDGLDQKSDAFWNRLRFYQGTAFLRIALVYGLRPKWARLSPTLVELGRRCLEEQIRIG